MMWREFQDYLKLYLKRNSDQSGFVDRYAARIECIGENQSASKTDSNGVKSVLAYKLMSDLYDYTDLQYAELLENHYLMFARINKYGIQYQLMAQAGRIHFGAYEKGGLYDRYQKKVMGQDLAVELCPVELTPTDKI